MGVVPGDAVKTRELIAELQAADPSGELPVCVDGEDIYFVERLPGYYDGAYQQLIHDESKKPYWSIVGGKITRKGEKVRIQVMSIRDVIQDMPDLPVELDEGMREYYENKIAEWRAEAVES